MKRWLGGIGWLVLVLGVAPARGQDAPDAGAAFDRVYEEFSRAYRDGDPAGVAALYTDDAWYLAPGDSIQRGEVLRHFEWLSSYEPGRGPVVEFEIVDRAVTGDLGYDVGYYRIRAAGAPEESASGGKFIVVWKRGADGTWRIHADGYSEVRGEEERQ
ncbi:MAG TPA: nuclear transport factor 2 family protein [Gemmatimonadota bacterium]|nr:nuclear transport factor 2 family protein [Gemmatimonadota bacterium]